MSFANEASPAVYLPDHSSPVTDDANDGRMRPGDGKGKARWEPKSYPVHYRSIMRMQLKNFSLAEIAEMIDMSIGQVYNITRCDLYKSEMRALQKDADKLVLESTTVNVSKAIERLSGRSVEMLEVLLEDTATTPRLRADIAFDLLDRAGYGAVERKEVVVDYATIATNAYKRRTLRLVNDPPVIVDNVPNQPAIEAPVPKQYALEGFGEKPSESAEIEQKDALE